MRFYKKPSPSSGDKRIRTWFAWFPVTIGLETRWIEKVVVRQRFGIMHWFDIEFVDEKEV